MDPSNELFRSRCESNPALITRASVQWLESWSATGMKDIAASRIKSIEAVQAFAPSTESGKNMDGSEIASSMVTVHQGMGVNVQPREYVAFVNLFSKIYSNKRKQVSDQKNFLKGGLSKLKEAEDTVDTLSRAADKQRAELVIKQKEAEEALVSIQSSMQTAAERSKDVKELKKQQAIDEVEMKSRRGGVELELAEVQPMIDAARKAVGQIKKDNIDEIRSLKMPPEAIRDVLEGVLTVLNQQDTSWNNMKKFLGQKSVRDDIIEYDARKITPEIRSKVDKLLAQKGNSFQEAVIYRVSVAAAPLAAWVKANMSYSKVLEKVAPLENELQGLKDRLDESARLIVEYEKELKECDEAVARLKTDFSKKTSVAETLRAGLEKAEATVNAAK
jgi:dynein heavy chain 2